MTNNTVYNCSLTCPCALAAQAGDLNALRYAHEITGIEIGFEIAVYAARYGHLACLRYAYEHGCRLNYQVYVDAASNGHIDCLRYALKQECMEFENIHYAYYYAAEHGCLNCMQCLYEHGGVPDNKVPFMSVMTVAACNGHVDCLQFAHETLALPIGNAASGALLNGHLNCLQYAHEHGAQLNTALYRRAQINGHYDCMQYLDNHGFGYVPVTLI
jgi:hypothetical protein